jgi:hypothetical protein
VGKFFLLRQFELNSATTLAIISNFRSDQLVYDIYSPVVIFSGYMIFQFLGTLLAYKPV